MFGERGILKLHNSVVSVHGTGPFGSEVKPASLDCFESNQDMLHAVFKDFFTARDSLILAGQRDLAVLRINEDIYAHPNAAIQNLLPARCFVTAKSPLKSGSGLVLPDKSGSMS
jgi:hypothetical protein